MVKNDNSRPVIRWTDTVDSYNPSMDKLSIVPHLIDMNVVLDG